jgi:hypothetical protein
MLSTFLYQLPSRTDGSRACGQERYWGVVFQMTSFLAECISSLTLIMSWTTKIKIKCRQVTDSTGIRRNMNPSWCGWSSKFKYHFKILAMGVPIVSRCDKSFSIIKCSVSEESEGEHVTGWWAREICCVLGGQVVEMLLRYWIPICWVLRTSPLHLLE